MNSNLDKVRARARLLLAADQWRELLRFLETDVPNLVAEIEQLQSEVAEKRRYGALGHAPVSEALKPSIKGHTESQLLTVRQFAGELAITEACVRRWVLERRIKVIRIGRLVRIPRTEIQRLIGEGATPVRPSRTHLE